MVTVTSRNTISQVGCLVTTLANVLSFLGYPLTPAGVDAVADENNFYGVNLAFLNEPGAVVEKVTEKKGVYDRKNSFDVSKVEKLLLGGVPVVGRFGENYTHFVTMAGYRKNAKGEIIGFLIRDPGSRNPVNYFVDRKKLIYPKDDRKLSGYAYIQF